jgi:L-asparagine transporter-like permease
VSRLAISLVLRILFFYVGSVLLIVLIVPWSEVKVGVSPFAQTLEHLNIPGAAVVMNAVVLTAVLSCLNSGIYISSRVLFSLAGHGDAPKSLVKLSPRRRVPVAAILLGSSLGFAAILTQGGQAARVFSFLVNASGALTFFVYLLIAVAQIRLRNRLDRDAPGSFTVRMWAHPWLSVLVIVAIVAMLAAMALDPARAPELYASLASLAVVVLFAALRFRGSANPKSLN